MNYAEISSDPKKNWQKAFDLTDSLGIERSLEVEDVIADPDPFSLILFLSQVYHFFDEEDDSMLYAMPEKNDLDKTQDESVEDKLKGLTSNEPRLTSFTAMRARKKARRPTRAARGATIQPPAPMHVEAADVPDAPPSNVVDIPDDKPQDSHPVSTQSRPPMMGMNPAMGAALAQGAMLAKAGLRKTVVLNKGPSDPPSNANPSQPQAEWQVRLKQRRERTLSGKIIPENNPSAPVKTSLQVENQKVVTPVRPVSVQLEKERRPSNPQPMPAPTAPTSIPMVPTPAVVPVTVPVPTPVSTVPTTAPTVPNIIPAAPGMAVHTTPVVIPTVPTTVSAVPTVVPTVITVPTTSSAITPTPVSTVPTTAPEIPTTVTTIPTIVPTDPTPISTVPNQTTSRPPSPQSHEIPPKTQEDQVEKSFIRPVQVENSDSSDDEIPTSISAFPKNSIHQSALFSPLPVPNASQVQVEPQVESQVENVQPAVPAAKEEYVPNFADRAATETDLSYYVDEEGKLSHMDGFLNKLSHGKLRDRWKGRWFKLVGEQLLYYKDEQPKYTIGRENPPKGIIHLREIVDLGRWQPKKNIIQISTLDRIYYLEAESEVDMFDWILALTQMQKQMAQQDNTVQWSPTRRAYLRKEGPIDVKSTFGFKKRYLSLQSGTLIIRKGKEAKIKTKMSLYGATLEEYQPEKRTLAFLLTSPSKSIILRFSNEEEMHQWANTIQMQKVILEETIDSIVL
eukprot:TRINITY_DN780_c1_g1_i5.p1 TRINITY_DN780_c1_g1~~TRINITY_DN780_c1_g1_i5.p1  ORF type:complete len:784 (+),score=293.16 TRINITY_DN780_c1_g1_i5:153-2354(+)